MKMFIPLCLVAVSLAGAATEPTKPEPTDQKKETSAAWCRNVADNDKGMDRAVTKARESLGFFLAALKAQKPGTEAFEVKKCVIDGEKVEHVWVGDVTWDGKAFHGRVDNKPLDITNARLGQLVTVRPEDLTDWMFVRDGKLMGGFTTRVLFARLSAAEKTEFQKEADFKIE